MRFRNTLQLSFFSFVILLFSFVFGLEGAKLPDIDPPAVSKKINEIMHYHASHKKMNSLLVKRALNLFIEELDPVKIYFIEPDIHQWLNPSDELLQQILNDYNNSNFHVFEEIYEQMLNAIQRRHRLESQIVVELPAKTITSEEIKKMPWAANEAELVKRLSDIKSMQIEAANKLSPELRERSLQRIAKRQAKYEEELKSNDPLTRQHMILSKVLKASAASLDTHTVYFTPAEASQFMINVQQKLYGIGVQLRDDINGFTVTKIVEGGPASLTKELKLKDRIIAVNGEPVVGMDITDAVELIRGNENTPVVLTIMREPSKKENKLGSSLAHAAISLVEHSLKASNKEEFISNKDSCHCNSEKAYNYSNSNLNTNLGNISAKGSVVANAEPEILEITLLRGEVVLKESRLETSFEPFGDGVIATLKLHSFYQDQGSSSADDIISEFNKLKQDHNIKGVILDLRYNTGGMLTQAVAVTGLFITKGVVVSIKEETGNVQHLRDIDGTTMWNGPLIVLVNKASASASEIVAQTLQDYGQAIIVGDDHTYGKGSFQTFSLSTERKGNEVNPQGEYKVTRGRYYTVSGKSPQLIGVLPDINVPGPLSESEIGEKYATYPLESDNIKPNFDDDLSDIPPLQREQARMTYKINLQPKMNTYAPYLPILRANSEKRIQENLDYKNFLVEVKKKESNPETVEVFGQNDMQLNETYQIMKDLIILMVEQHRV